MADSPKRLPWLVREHHRMRTASFAMLFAAIAVHIAGKHYGAVDWLMLALLFLVYPQLQFWRVRRARNPVLTEIDNLVVDSVLLGATVAALAFPLWISFSAMLATLSNNAANKGVRGIWQAGLALLAGAMIAVAVSGFHFEPHTEWPVAAMCIIGLSGYLLAMNANGYRRNLELRLARYRLQKHEKELLAANEALQSNLRDIDLLQDQLREQANRDPLTGLYNRRYFDSTLGRELARCEREGHPLALILIDIDHFKRVNDTYGHQAGDQMLVQLAKILSGMGRAADVPCRFGGEEFLLLMPTMSLETARERAQELRSTFAATTVRLGDFRFQSTISAGIAVFPEHGASADDLIRRADAALYKAKYGGRNRIEG